ncbi:hypothetical protein BDQ17DRAFT_1431213 [Cyathus striatus]|nr:hypothetical protein BDQ17DRAFT_1431213 [Cyathus striatus]
MDPYYARSQSIKEWLPLAMSRLSKVNTFIWHINHLRSDDWSRDCVISGITQMPSLTALELNVDLRNRDAIQLHSLPPVQVLSIGAAHQNSISRNGSIQGLRELIAKSSRQLRQLTIKSSHPIQVERSTPLLCYLLQDTSHLHLKHLSLDVSSLILSSAIVDRLRSLESLSIKNAFRHTWWSPSSSEEDLHSQVSSDRDVWHMLMVGRIHLQEITIDESTESFVAYLGSYIGLKVLVITGAMYNTQAQSDVHAIEFYRNALFTHANTLEKLVISPTYEGKWCFGEHCMRVLSSLVNLRLLTISIVVDSAQILFEDSYSDNGSPTTTTRNNHYDPSHPVCLLMQTGSTLPKLNMLSIRGASLSANREVECGNGRVSHPIYPDTQIDIHVTSNGPLHPSEYKFIIENGGSHYTLQRLDDSEGCWYRQNYTKNWS